MLDGQSADQGEAIADGHRNHDVGGGEEHPVQREALTVRLWVQYDQQHHREEEIDGRESDDPTSFPRLHQVDEEEGSQADEQVDQVEFLRGALRVAGELLHELHRIALRVGLFVLSAGGGVFEALDRARVAPVHGRVAHRGDRHVEVE